MRTTTKKLENAVTQIKVTFDKKEWAEAQDAALKRLATRVKLDGFRPGKAPVAMIKARLGKQAIYDEATDQILQKRYADIMKKAEVAPIAQPTLNIDSVDNDNLKITILCPVKPEVELGEYKGLEVKKGRVTVAKKDIEAQVENYRHQFAELTTKENGEVAKGDTVVMDFEGFIDGEAFEGGKAEGHNLVIGSGSFIPGFEDQLVGKKAGEEVDVNVTFPADYHAEELAGAPVVFKVKVNAVKVKELPELNDEFAQDTTEFETLAELKADLKAKAEEEAAAKAKSEERNAVVEAVVANTEVEVPETMVNAQIDSSIMELNYSLQYQGFSIEQLLEMTGKSMQELRDERKEDAEKSVKASLVVDAIAKAENVEVSEEEVEAEVAKMAEAYNMTLPQIKEALKSNDLEDIKGQLRIRKTIDFLVENAVIA